MLFSRAVGVLIGASAVRILAEPYNTFDGPGFPACRNVSAVHNVTSVDEMVSIVKDAAADGIPVRASGKGHMWFDTMCQDDPRTVIIRTENTNGISDLQLEAGAESGSVVIEAGVTFLQLAEWLHERNASMGYTLVNWNISMAGAVAMGAHRSSIREESMVAAGVLSLDIINGNGDIVTIDRDESSDDWLAASTSLGLLGVIARLTFKVYPDFKVFAKQDTYDEDDILNGDIYGLIAPYATANFWVSLSRIRLWLPRMRLIRYWTVVAVPQEVPPSLLRRDPHNP